MAKYAPDRIFAPADSIRRLAREVPTPFYLYDEQGILDSLSAVRQWFSWDSLYCNYFPLRENINPVILKMICAAESGVSVCNLAELKLAADCGFQGTQLLYAPTRFDPQAEQLAVELDALWMVNAPALLPLQLPQRLILRYHPSDLRMTPMQTKAVGRSKNGFTRQQILDSVQALSGRGVQKIGLSLEVSSYNVSVGAWLKKAKVLRELTDEIQSSSELRVDCWYLGEGPGLPYRPNVTVADPAEEAAAVQRMLEQRSPDDRPTIYTGISKRLLEPHGLLITGVLEHRALYRSFLVMDACMSQYVRPALKQAYRHISILGRDDIEGRKLYTPVGELPDELDRFDQRGRMLPVATTDDYCIIHDVGCGGRSMPLLYGLHSIPAEYLYKSDGTIVQIAPGRSAEEVRSFLTAW